MVGDAQQHRVVGYHALTAAGLEREAATPRVIKGMPRYPVPVVLLARLAVDVSVTGRGLGAWLLRDAMLRTLAAADTIGVRALLVHAADDDARRFYLRHGLDPAQGPRRIAAGGRRRTRRFALIVRICGCATVTT